MWAPGNLEPINNNKLCFQISNELKFDSRDNHYNFIAFLRFVIRLDALVHEFRQEMNS